MSEDKDIREVEGKDLDGNDVKVLVKKPSVKDYRDSQVEYNQTFRTALESGALLKKKLNEYMREQGIWDDSKQEQYDEFIEKITAHEKIIEDGGIALKEAKRVALDLRELRIEFRSLIAERNSLDSNTAEGQADNARFNSLVALCILNPDKTRKFTAVDEYDKVSAEPWAVKAAGELASMLYALDPDYDKNLTENQFLIDYEFADDELRLINKDGHLIDVDDAGNERLVDENGRFIEYDDDGEQIFVNREGEEVSADGKRKRDFKPFLDADGSPVVLQNSSKEDDSDDEEDSEEATEEATEEAKPKTRGRPKKTPQKA